MFFNALPGLQNELKQVSQEMEKLLPKEWNSGNVGAVIQDILAGRGKGYRPSLLLLMAKLGPEYLQRKERLYRLGALVEFVHMASLIHDDIIDDSSMRRGNPTIQAKFGKETAVFAGDLILGQVMHVLLKEGMRESGLLISGTVQDMCRGEIMQACCRYHKAVTKDEYYQNIYGKTASMFVTVCKIGALESGCSEEIINRLGELGLHLGYLFQIRDDLLDFLPMNQEDGKPVRMDFREGILTLPVIFTLEKEECRQEMEELVEKAKDGMLEKKSLDRLDQLILKAEGFKRTVDEANKHKYKIEEILSELPKTKEIKAILHLISLLKLPELG